MVQQTYQAWQTNFYKKPPLFILKSPKGTENFVNSRGSRAKFHHSGFFAIFYFLPTDAPVNRVVNHAGLNCSLVWRNKNETKIGENSKESRGSDNSRSQKFNFIWSLKEFDPNRYFYWNKRQNFSYSLKLIVPSIQSR